MFRIHRSLQRIGYLLATLFLLVVAAVGGEPAFKSTDFTPGSWTLVVLPDTQIYSEAYPGLFTLQTHWVAKNKDKYNIGFVLQLGDVTNHNTELEWEHARDAMSELDGKVPYALVTGNHDFSSHAARDTRLNDYFPVAQFKDRPDFGGAMNDDMSNTYHFFTAGGIDWIVIALEWAPRNESVQWANDVLAKYPERKAILITHAYLFRDGTRYDSVGNKELQGGSPHAYATNVPVNDGEALWQKLVSKNNFAFTFSGHLGADGPGILASKNDRGQTVHQMLVDYQSRQLGGEGYLRILEFQPDGKTVRVKTYSPLYDKYMDDENSQFSIELEPTAAANVGQ